MRLIGALIALAWLALIALAWIAVMSVAVQADEFYPLIDCSGLAVVKSAKVEPAKPYRSPPGYHRHRLADGTIIEHGDWNYGDPVAHAGVVGSNWPKYSGPLPPTSRSKATVYQYQSNCPGGVCPSPQRRGLFRW